MTEADLDQHAQALTSSAFTEHDLALLEVVAEQGERDAAAADPLNSLSRATGVRDRRTLQMLLDRGITADKAAALALIPLVAVAWADGRLQDAEVQALLSAAHDQGIEKGTPAYDLFHRWLLVEPSRSLRAAWANYVMALCRRLTDEQKESLREQTLERAVTIAEAAGGLFGIGRKVSENEAEILEELSMAFD